MKLSMFYPSWWTHKEIPRDSMDHLSHLYPPLKDNSSEQPCGPFGHPGKFTVGLQPREGGMRREKDVSNGELEGLEQFYSVDAPVQFIKWKMEKLIHQVAVGPFPSWPLRHECGSCSLWGVNTSKRCLKILRGALNHVHGRHTSHSKDTPHTRSFCPLKNEVKSKTFDN